MQKYLNPDKKDWDNLLRRPMNRTSELKNKVSDILEDIRENGEKAVRKYSKMFDRSAPGEIAVSLDEIEESEKLISNDLKNAIKQAAKNIRKFHETQRQTFKKTETVNGVVCWQKAVPIQKVGLYIPGGTAPLFSTVLMLGIPAKIAGCKKIILCTPPDRKGNINPAILFAAKVAEITDIFKVGGAQAIGAMAYGAGKIPRTNKIFGPGNQYVMTAKQIISLYDVAIDMPAGPSEVAVMADKNSDPEFIASDLLSQAEHGPDSQVLLVTNDEDIIDKTELEIKKQLSMLSRKDIALKSLSHSVAVVLDSKEKMADIINAYAPEHLIISMNNYQKMSEKIVNAGSVFLGKYSPESAGDYASGTNHTLPTNGWAHAYSGINLDSFIKKITFQEISEEGIKNLGPVIETMAEAEHLGAHKNAVTIRLNKIKK